LEKLKTPSVILPSGQSVQVHYYRNAVTGEVNYNIDFKVVGEIIATETPTPKKPPKPTK
jgi:hypothetical protein